MNTSIALLPTGLLLVSGSALGQPIITNQPADQSVSLGANVVFAVAATSPQPLHFQWQFKAMDVPGGTNNTMAITGARTNDAGAYAVVVANSSGSITSRVAHLDVDPSFTKITTGSIVADPGNAFACAWGDYDNDDYLDLLITNTYDRVKNRPQALLLFHNNHDGTFSKITNTVVTSETKDWHGCSWVDYNNDGNLDLIVTTASGNGFPAETQLFRNNGDGTFTKMTAADAGDLVFQGGDSEAVVCADFDNDGFVDVFVTGYRFDRWLHNDGNGSFRTNGLSGPTQHESYGAAFADYNNDGWPDLFVPVKSDPVGNLLYLNSGAGSFSRVTSGGVFTDRAYSFMCAWGDYDNDGNLDLFVANGGYFPSPERNFLYHNDGNGTLTRVTNAAVGPIVTDAGDFGFCAWGDYDNDGFLDLFVVNAPQANFYHNNGDGTFTRILTGSLVNDGGANPVSCAWGDYDNDGFLDLVVVRGADSNPETNLLYHNNGNSNGWVRIRLVGTISNRSAVGAKVRVQAISHGKPLRQLREINTGSGFVGGPLEAHFGLGDATNIDSVRIEWPSGVMQTLSNLPPRQILTVIEHQDNAAPSAFDPIQRSTNGTTLLSLRVANGPSDAVYVLERSIDLMNWTKVGLRTNVTARMNLADTYATNYSRAFYRATAP